MKRCPTCHRTFAEEHLVYCVDDGTPLVKDDSVDETTVVTPAPDSTKEFLSSSPTDESGTSAYQPPRPYSPPDYQQEKRRNWPAVIGVLVVVILIVGGMAVAAVVFVPRVMRASRNSNSRSLNPNFNRANLNSNSNNQNSNSENWNANENANASVVETTPPPTDQNQVLADLRDLEDEWTVANINADKKVLNRILADDYVGVSNGKSQGKAEYLKTAERDTSIQHWEFADLKLTLNRDRATLSGILNLDFKNQKGEDEKATLRFTDKFVWRDARWQATASVVETLPEKPGTTL
ncbi:MAG TPA: nuclear transport factor 2 family protein [Pyrinomonadaceae bacterium]|nr:nuclear transport factor 2 family protein [Pyrinomonadaceae bacterium]